MCKEREAGEEEEKEYKIKHAGSESERGRREEGGVRVGGVGESGRRRRH